MKTILYLNHRASRCGVYELGRATGEALANSTTFRFVYAEVDNEHEAQVEADTHLPQAVILNWHPGTMPWMRDHVAAAFARPIGTAVHDQIYPAITHAHLHLDPTFPECWGHFRIGRLVPEFSPQKSPQSDVPVIGSFGFGFDNKGFERLIATVNQEFDAAVVRLHITAATFGDQNGDSARAIAARCRELCKPGIELKVSHEYLTRQELLTWLAGNSINCFFYDTMYGRGIASVTDLALAVGRPVAVSQSWMFRHLLPARDLISVESASLTSILDRGDEPLKPFRAAWTQANLVADYERVAAFLTDGKS